MRWEPDPAATAVAREAFAPLKCAPVVHRSGQQLLIAPTPFGRIELLPVDSRLLIVAERPPYDAPGFDVARCPPHVRRHMTDNGLRAWKQRRGPRQDLASILADLLAPAAEADRGGAFSPLLCPLPPAAEVVGESRQQVAGHLANLLRARRAHMPLPVVAGLCGAGRRTIVQAAAAKLGLAAGELPLGRVFLVERVLQSPMEALLELLMQASAAMDDAELLAVSGAELLDRLAPEKCAFVLDELSRLPHVVLVADSAGAPDIPGTVHLRCAGLSEVRQAARLLALAQPSLSLAGAALEMLCRAASAPHAGILPGRLLYLAELALARTAGRTQAPAISPDDAALAVGFARQTWRDDEQEDL